MVRRQTYHLLFLASKMLRRSSRGPVNPSFPISTEHARQAIGEMKRNPVALPRPLLIVGGFLNFLWPPWCSRFFSKLGDGRNITAVSLASCGSFEQCRAKMIDALDRAFPNSDPNWTETADVIGASMGGLAARYAAAPSRDPLRPRRLRIARLFTISSPHSGARAANALAVSAFHRDMRSNSDFLQSLAQFDQAAGYELYPYVQLNDTTVGEQLAAPPGQTAYWVSNETLIRAHTAAMVDERILADIARRLRGEPPFSHFPPTPLPVASGKHA
jgi:pimeloyl-ACP methyl ester carboxylesterase